jgi:hypothetical protein
MAWPGGPHPGQIAEMQAQAAMAAQQAQQAQLRTAFLLLLAAGSNGYVAERITQAHRSSSDHVERR